ncbi:uncharacterized protein CDAR_425951 [Caerostris darwini]|uniref:Uncharacterized protein n=1 Tax=Caerostris darwini TaxID=1538125 RepID=A0AAV4T4D8_9ARAC|nr:uncharacterized protein CDAR_425951 [Caerostris darwini]
MYPAKPYSPDFESDSYARSHLSLFTDLNRYHNFQNININYGEYKDGYALPAIDLTPDFVSNESHTSRLTLKVSTSHLDRAPKFQAITDEEDDEPESSKKRKFDLNLSEEIENLKSIIPPYSIYLVKGLSIEIKEFRKSYYVTYSKFNEKGDVKNRFNITVDQIATFVLGLTKMNECVKQH